MLGNGSVVTADGMPAVGLLTFQAQVRSEARESLSPSAGPARPIKFYSFIFRSFAVSSSCSAIAVLDGVQLTAP